MESILIVEDNKDMQFILSKILKEKGYKTIIAGDGIRAIEKVEKYIPDLVLLDIKLPKLDGMQVLDKIKKIDEDLPIIMITAFGNIKGAVNAMKSGAYDYITKPFNNEELILIIQKALKAQYMSREVKILRQKINEMQPFDKTMGESTQIKKIIKQVELIAPTKMSVIIQGKSGTGKEVIANMIHQRSPRKDEPFIPVDCGAIPDTLIESELFGYEKGAFTDANYTKKGKFELANKGTLLFDEITNLPYGSQAKLLRVIEEKKVQRIGSKEFIPFDVRIIATTNIDILNAVKQGNFRDDLYHRLFEFIILLPKLSQRKDDIPILAMEFLNEANIELKKNIRGFSAKAMELMLSYNWPGNVRELKNVIKRAVLITESDDITLDKLYPLLDNSHSIESKEISEPKEDSHISELYDKDFSFENQKDKFEKKLIIKVLKQTGGNRTKAAEILNINRKKLYRKMKHLNLIK